MAVREKTAGTVWNYREADLRNASTWYLQRETHGWICLRLYFQNI